MLRQKNAVERQIFPSGWNGGENTKLKYQWVDVLFEHQPIIFAGKTTNYCPKSLTTPLMPSR
jgi:hypothetical protein